MRTSATDRESAATAAIVREAARRLAHHISNAANSAAVNVEVLRSRLARGGGGAESLGAFADRAAAATEEISGGVGAVRALLNALGDAVASGGMALRPVRGEPGAVEVVGSSAVSLDSAAARFAEAAGVSVRGTPRGVILTLLRRGAVDNGLTE